MDLIAQHQLDKASQIYYCVVKSVADNQCTIVFNNKQYTVPYYGGKPTPNKTYAIFLPHNNMNESFVIGDGKDGGTEGEIVPITEGGTGADNAADARANLAVPNMQTDTFPTLLPPDGSDDWIKIGKANSSYGLLPSQGGGGYGSGHNYLGASTWYWDSAFVDRYYGGWAGDTIPIGKGGTGATSASAANASLQNYSLLEGIQIELNTDLNTIVTPNIYRTSTDSITASLINKPLVTQPFQLVVMYINGGHAVMQHVNEWLTGNEWRRFGYIGGGSWTWDAWQKISERFPLSVGSGGTGATSGANALANLGVIEAFSAGAGSLELPNGTLIQWGATTLDVTNALTQIGTSGVYQGAASLTFPIAFADASFYLSGLVKYSTGYEVPCGFSPTSSTAAFIRIYDFYARPASSTAYKLHWFAIGRWA